MEDQKLSEQSYSSSSDSDDDIPTEQFERLLNKQKKAKAIQDIQFKKAIKWSELKINKIYTITSYKTVKTTYGETPILTLSNNKNVWCPQHLYNKINKASTPLFVRPLGLKKCTNSNNMYHSYDLVLL